MVIYEEQHAEKVSTFICCIAYVEVYSWLIPRLECIPLRFLFSVFANGQFYPYYPGLKDFPNQHWYQHMD